jgi:hypothetical protein
MCTMRNLSLDPKRQPGGAKRTGAILARGPAAEAAWRAANGLGKVVPINAHEQRRRLIEQTAYFYAQRRGFTPGHELEDWLAAEQAVDTASRPLSRR